MSRLFGFYQDTQKIQPKVAIPAHGEMVTGEELEMKLSEYENKILERDRKIREIIKAGEDPVGRGIIYRRFWSRGMYTSSLKG